MEKSYQKIISYAKNKYKNYKDMQISKEEFIEIIIF